MYNTISGLSTIGSRKEELDGFSGSNFPSLMHPNIAANLPTGAVNVSGEKYLGTQALDRCSAGEKYLGEQAPYGSLRWREMIRRATLDMPLPESDS